MIKTVCHLEQNHKQTMIVFKNLHETPMGYNISSESHKKRVVNLDVGPAATMSCEDKLTR